jgi:hypothetical protein
MAARYGELGLPPGASQEQRCSARDKNLRGAMKSFYEEIFSFLYQFYAKSF